MSEAGDVGEQKSNPQRGGQIRVFHFAASDPPDDVHQPDHQRLHQHQTKKRMGEAAMVGEAEDGIFEVPDDVDIGSFRRQRHGGCGQCCLTIEPGTRQAGAGQKVSDGFQRVL